MLCRVALVRTDVSEEGSTSVIRVRRLLVTAVVIFSSPILVPLMEALSSSETSVLTRATRCNIPKNTILRKWASFSNLVFSNIRNSNDGQSPDAQYSRSELT
jgi:hypothetical protein